eukprot:gene17264-23801_t
MIGLPNPSQTAWSLEFKPPLVRGVDHDPVGLACLARQLCKYAVEHAQAAPADEAVVDRLVRAIILGRIAPHQAMLDDVDDARNNPSVIDPRHTMRQRKKWLDPAHLRLAQQERNIHHGTSSVPSLNQPMPSHASNLT